MKDLMDVACVFHDKDGNELVGFPTVTGFSVEKKEDGSTHRQYYLQMGVLVENDDTRLGNEDGADFYKVTYVAPASMKDIRPYKKAMAANKKKEAKTADEA